MHRPSSRALRIGILMMDHDPERDDDRAIALALAATSLLEGAPTGAAVGLGPSLL